MVHISSSWVKISLYTEIQLPRLPGSRTASFRLKPGDQISQDTRNMMISLVLVVTTLVLVSAEQRKLWNIFKKMVQDIKEQDTLGL